MCPPVLQPLGQGKSAAAATLSPLRRFEDWDDAGLLAACRAAYKKAGCCLMLGRHDDALSESKAALAALQYALEKEGGWGRDVFGE